MMTTIRAEFRKLLSVRSTYVIAIACLLIVMLFAGYIEGFHNNAASLQQSTLLATQSVDALAFVGIIFAFAGLLLFGHEYRYNTIMYSLTSSNRRLKVLLAKLVAITAFALVTSLLVAFFSPLCTIIGAHLQGNHIGPQTFNYVAVIWRCLFMGWAYAMYAFILIAIIRSQVGAIVTFLLIPFIGESILTVLLKDNSQYLPFTTLQNLTNIDGYTTFSAGQSVTVAMAYIIIGLAISAVLFSRRDAN